MTATTSRRLRLGAAVAGLGVLAAGCAKDAPQDTWDPAGPAAQQIDDLQRPIFAIAGVIGVIVFAVVLVIILKFRGRKGSERVPRQIHGAPRLEIAWTLAPAVLLAAIAVPTVTTIFDLAEKPEESLTVNVIGQQWWWEFDYPSIFTDSGRPIVTSGEMVIPAGQWVTLNITSRDVIHSFWIPRLNGKKDAVPGRVHFLKLKADEPGTYWGQCTEFCGLSHANMRQRVVALSPEDWDRWVANQKLAANAPTDQLALEGEALFKGQCVRCHQVDGLTDDAGDPLVSRPDQQLVAGAAPNLTHLMSRTTFGGVSFDLKQPGCTNDPAFDDQFATGTAANCLNEADLERWLRNTPAMKPMYSQPTEDTGTLIRGMPALGLTEEQIDALVAYLVTLT